MAHQISFLLLLVVAIAAIALSIGTSSAGTTPQPMLPQVVEQDLKKMVGRLNTTFTQFNATSKLRESFFSMLRKGFVKPEKPEDFEKMKGHLNTSFNHFNATSKLRESIWTQLRKGLTEMHQEQLKSKKQVGDGAHGRTTL